jgi:hypothetical protein
MHGFADCLPVRVPERDLDPGEAGRVPRALPAEVARPELAGTGRVRVDEVDVGAREVARRRADARDARVGVDAHDRPRELGLGFAVGFVPRRQPRLGEFDRLVALDAFDARDVHRSPSASAAVVTLTSESGASATATSYAPTRASPTAKDPVVSTVTGSLPKFVTHV